MPVSVIFFILFNFDWSIPDLQPNASFQRTPVIYYYYTSDMGYRSDHCDEIRTIQSVKILENISQN